MPKKYTELLKEIAKLQTIAERMVKRNLKINGPDFRYCLINALDYRLKNPENCSDEGIRSAEKRNFSPKYHADMADALRVVIQESESKRGKLLQDRNQEDLLLNAICDAMEMASNLVQIITDFDKDLIPKDFESFDTVKNVDPRFVYAINKSFNALKTLTLQDLFFLCIYRRSDTRGKVCNLLNEKIDLSLLQIDDDYVNEVTTNWVKARREFSFKRTKEEISAFEEWRIFIDKFKALKSFDAVIDANRNGENKDKPKERYQKWILILFLKIIWPREENTNTNFGPQDIDALLVFKNCLSAESQVDLLNEFNDVFE